MHGYCNIASDGIRHPIQKKMLLALKLGALQDKIPTAIILLRYELFRHEFESRNRPLAASSSDHFLRRVAFIQGDAAGPGRGWFRNPSVQPSSGGAPATFLARRRRPPRGATGAAPAHVGGHVGVGTKNERQTQVGGDGSGGWGSPADGEGTGAKVDVRQVWDGER